MPTTTLRTEADVVAAAAALLGFAPTNSIVAYTLHRDPDAGDMAVRTAIRFDVTISIDQAARFPATVNLRPETTHAAVLLAVCDQPHEWHALTILDALRGALRDAGIPVLRRIITRDVTTEGQWYDPDSGATGPTYPYTDSLVTAHRVLGGDRVSPDRSEVEAEFAYLPPAPPLALGDHSELVIQVAQEVADALEGHPVSRSLPTRAGIAITADVAVRDAMIAAAAQHTDTGAYLWTHIARRLRGQPRAEALTIAAACYCLLADTVRAGIAAQAAVDEAHTSQSTPPRLALMLLAALHSGIPPEKIRRALITAPNND
ncbi:hypothetical protein AN931_25675 [Mycobacterium intracellulare subsp. chimaera]|nr:DUF4192 family protein [Mycobacterium intracellulare]KPN44937.1 hypothetical protein AN933_29515 [Mycobacterium intracellulare subsp. chimaera]KPN46467.1 hypothetical protein AN931_25675 [Mycobacterium intracellulare subsp. chimaera]MDM3908882.1 DUF4192 family protein [Mycobacterium intracellulare subsp. chimaera]